MVWPFNNPKETDPLWLKIAYGEIGVKEIPGKKHNPRVIEYHNTCTYNARRDEVAWCSAFINWCIIQAGYRGTNKVNARSWLDWGKSLPKHRGAVTVLWREHPSSWKGHVAFYIKSNEKYVWLLGGNQSNKVCIKKYPLNKVLSYRGM